MAWGNSEEGACTHVALIAACITSRKKEDKELFLTKEDINFIGDFINISCYFLQGLVEGGGCSMQLVES